MEFGDLDLTLMLSALINDGASVTITKCVDPECGCGRVHVTVEAADDREETQSTITITCSASTIEESLREAAERYSRMMGRS